MLLSRLDQQSPRRRRRISPGFGGPLHGGPRRRRLSQRHSDRGARRGGPRRCSRSEQHRRREGRRFYLHHSREIGGAATEEGAGYSHVG